MACSLRSTRITGRHRYYGTVRRCMPRFGTLLLTDLAAWRSPSCARLSHRPPRSRCRGRSFPRSTLAPEPSSRRLYAGCRLGRKQVPPRLVPSRSAFSVVTSLEVPLDASSAVHSRSPSRLTPDALVERLFRNVHHPGRGAGAACGSLEPPPSRRSRGAYPHRQRSIASGYVYLHGLPSTFVAQQNSGQLAANGAAQAVPRIARKHICHRRALLSVRNSRAPHHRPLVYAVS